MPDTILITGGAGFVGSSLALRLKGKYPATRVISLDNLKRRGSELNLTRLKQSGVQFIHGDIRNREDLADIGPVDMIIECSAEPSVLAGYTSAPEYLVNTNLLGTINCLEIAAKYKVDFIFLSTSRVYPFQTINALEYLETDTRFELSDDQKVSGCSQAGFTEDFPIIGLRSLYGTTKLASELLIQEYADMYGFNAVINRCGVIAGPWQFGKIDQGFVVLWLAKHIWRQELSYIGYGGEGKQVRDILHIDDLFRLIDVQINNIGKLNGNVFNAGGGRATSVSLKELTQLCQELTANTIPLRKIEENRPADIQLYLSDNTKVTKATGWEPERSIEYIVEDIANWIQNNAVQLEGILK
jgi:CDP-paratose 2-epimerase